jgi:hypothetical protein
VRVGRNVYLCGGTRKIVNKVSQWPDTDIYDLVTDKWSKGPPMPMPRESSGAYVGEFIVVPGGYRANGADDRVDFLVPGENAWRTLPHLAHKVSAHATVFLGNFLFLFGDYTKLDSIVAYDLRTRTTLDVRADFKGARHAAAVAVENVIYVFGGNTSREAGESNLIQAFTINPNYHP